MQKVTTEQLTRPDSELDPEVIAFRKQFEPSSPLEELVRQGAQQMLQAAIESEVQDFLWQHADRKDDQGRRQVVRDGHLPSRQLQTGAGPLDLKQPRVRDNSPNKVDRVRFVASRLTS